MATKPAYQFDHAGRLLGETFAEESPREPGIFHLPARCTFTPPPATVPDDKWPRWNGVAWTLTQRPAPESEASAVEKLAAFLSANPDVAMLLEGEAPTT